MTIYDGSRTIDRASQIDDSRLLAVKPEAIDLVRNTRPGKQRMYVRPSARDGSPLWHQFVFRTVKEWNELPAIAAEAGSLDEFKSQLVAPCP